MLKTLAIVSKSSSFNRLSLVLFLIIFNHTNGQENPDQERIKNILLLFISQTSGCLSYNRDKTFTKNAESDLTSYFQDKDAHSCNTVNLAQADGCYKSVGGLASLQGLIGHWTVYPNGTFTNKDGSFLLWDQDLGPVAK